jgi:RNA polymerase sigma-70 factor, ECF subfamily
MSSEKTYQVLTDRQQFIIKGCIAGDRSSQQSLYDIYARRMMGVCLWYARNREEAEEILQDGFMKVFKYINTYKGKGSFEGWIRKIMVNTALVKCRSNSQLRIIVEFDAKEHDSKETVSIIEMLEAKDLLKLVQTLPPSYRMVFNLYVLEGMKHREIAEVLDISEGTSKSNLADARAILQKALQANKKVASLKYLAYE